MDIDGAVDMASTLAVGGVLTANAGVVVDTMTIDGSTLSATGDFILDSEGDIILDANGADFLLKDAGTLFLSVTNSSGDTIIANAVEDKDIFIRGNDNGSTITALTLDMSAAGAATFNSNVTSNAALIATSGVYTNNGVIYGNEAGIQLKDSGSRELATFHDTGLGTSNVAMGVNAGNSIASGGNYNTVVGDEAGTAITTGDYNTALGYQAGDAVTTGTQNTLVGGLAGGSLTVAINNVAVGTSALSSDTLGSASVAIGRDALGSQNFTSATDAYNVAVGAQAGSAVTTGTNNTLIGGLAGDAITTASNNVGIGLNAAGGTTTGANNIAIGTNSLLTNTTGASNVSVGTYALNANTTASVTTQPLAQACFRRKHHR